MKKLLCSERILCLAVAVALLAVFCTPFTVFAQSSQSVIEDWRNEDFAFSSRMMTTDRNDNIYVVGDTAVGDYLVIKKFSSDGALLWQTTYDAAERLRGVWIAIDGNGDPVVLATVIAGSNYTPAGWLTLKYDTNGSLLWANRLPGGFSDARRAEVDAGNNIYVAGRMWLTNAAGNTTHDSVLIKYSSEGALLWSTVFDNNSAVDEPYSLAISPDSARIAVAGVSGHLFMALMYDADGVLLWSDTGSAYPANDIAFGPENVSYFATGTYAPQAPDPYQMAIAKFDAAGNRLWIRSYSVGDRTFRVKVDSKGNVVATGIDQAGYLDWMTIKTDAEGNLLWSQRYDGGRNNDEKPAMLALDSFDSVYVTGTGGPNPSTGTVSYLKGVVAKYSSDGAPLWAVWDPYANGTALRLGTGNTLATLGFGYLVTAHYTQTGLTDPLPNGPTNLGGSAWFTGSSHVVNLSFTDNADNEFWVDVERCTGSGCTGFSKIGQTLGENSTGFQDRTAARGLTYMYRVRATGFMGASGYSNTVEVAVPAASLPAAPGNLVAALSGVDVVLNWQDNSANESQFYVERCEGTGCTSFMGVGASPANVATWTDFNAVAGRSYSYRVRAWNSDGYSSYSNIAAVITSEEPPAAKPAAPGSLTAHALSLSVIELTWVNNATSQDGVKIERCQGVNCANYVQITTVAGTPTTYTDSALRANTAYQYRVRAYNSAGDSPYSNTAGAKTLKR